MITAKAYTAKKFDQNILFEELRLGMDETAAEIKKQFNKTTKTWKHKVKFEKKKDYQPHLLTVVVFTEDEIYGYVHEGTKPHKIRAKNVPRLAFVWGGKGSYRSATVPRWIGSRGASVSGALVRPVEVNHPGTEAREFSEVIAEYERYGFKKRMNNHIKKAVKRSGHEVK